MLYNSIGRIEEENSDRLADLMNVKYVVQGAPVDQILAGESNLPSRVANRREPLASTKSCLIDPPCAGGEAGAETYESVSA